MEYKYPNLGYEWNEATRYSFFKKMGKEGWIDFVKNNSKIVKYSKIKDILGNIDLDFDNLKKEKRDRFKSNFNTKKIELPIVVKISDDSYDVVAGNTRIAGLVMNNIDPKLFVIDATNLIDYVESDVEEATDAGSSGAFVGALTGQEVVTRKVGTMNNSKQYGSVNESLEASASGGFDVPFLGSTPKGRKKPLSIGGPDTIKQSRAVKDKKFPKWGGPGGVFVKIKDKCKKFPYCNQGDMNALELYEEIDGLKEIIQKASKKHGFSVSEIENIVLNEIKQIFI